MGDRDQDPGPKVPSHARALERLAQEQRDADFSRSPLDPAMPNPAVLLRGTALDPGLPPGTSSRVIDEVSAATQAVDAAQKEVATAYHQLFVANEAENAARLDKRFARETYDRAVKALKAAREAFDKATSTGIAHI